MKKIISIITITLIFIINSNIFSQDIQEQKEKKKTVKTEEKILVYPTLYKDYIKRQDNLDTGEHFTLNLVVGVFSGGLFGYAGSFSQYHDPENDADDDDNTKYHLLYGAIFGLAGGVTGALLTWIEISNNIQFTYGKSLLNYAWYGTLGGGILGGLAGLIPYADNSNVDYIYNYAGYGAMAGLASGVLLYMWDTFFSSKEASGKTNLSFQSYYEKDNMIMQLKFIYKI